ncbi:hypothetical protein GQ457_03G015910 [Hibiscus cannabinus]
MSHVNSSSSQWKGVVVAMYGRYSSETCQIDCIGRACGNVLIDTGRFWMYLFRRNVRWMDNIRNLSNRLHWQGLWQCFDRHGEVLDVFVLTKCTVDGARFGFVRMDSWEDALRMIERVDGFVLYGSRVRVSFAQCDTRDSFWRRKMGFYQVSAKYASWRAWISTSGLPIHLWSEGSFRNIAGLWGKYLCVDAATEEPASFERARILIETSVKGRIDEVVKVASLGTMFLIVVQEAELVRVPVVEQRGVVDGASLSEQSQEASVASPRKNSPVKQVGDDSPNWHANQLWEIKSARKGRRASMVIGGASNRVVCDRGGVYSEGDADFAFTRIRSCEGLDIVHPSVSIAERESLGVKVVGDCESVEKYGRVVGMNGEGAHSTVILGLVGAVAAPIIGSAHGGVRNVKSVNTLVEALGSPAQKRVITVARSRRGCGRPAKVSRVEEAGRVVAKESLTDSDIHARVLAGLPSVEACLNLCVGRGVIWCCFRIRSGRVFSRDMRVCLWPTD